MRWAPAEEEAGAYVERLADLRDAGMELAVTYIPAPHRAECLEPLAEALAQLD